MRNFKNVFILLTLFLVGCGKDQLVFFDNPDPAPEVTVHHTLKEMVGNQFADILWVIDNSGSMDNYQQSVIQNASLFINEFTQKKTLNWKMGLLSSDIGENPYLGFAPGDELLSSSPDPVLRFQNAVSNLDTWGSGYEMFFDPIVKQMSQYPNFGRKAATLAIIFVTDAEEQSGTNDAQLFLDFLKIQKTSLTSVVVYGVFAANDLGCRSDEGFWNYAGSEYEEVIKATQGKVYPICSPDFGKNLADLGKDLVSRLTNPSIKLKVRPKIRTLEVLYQGKKLKGGLKENGGFWIYDFEAGSIVFHDTSFAPDDNESVEIRFEPDDGLP